jgi:hypothetical protein
MNVRNVNAGAVAPFMNRMNGTTDTRNGQGANQAAGNGANMGDRLILTPEGERMRATAQNTQAQRRVLTRKPVINEEQQQGIAAGVAPGQNERPGMRAAPIENERNNMRENAIQEQNAGPAENPHTVLEAELLEGAHLLQTPATLEQQNPAAPRNRNNEKLRNEPLRPNPAGTERENPTAANTEQAAGGNLTKLLQQETIYAVAQNQQNQNPMLNLLG